ncbi:putative metallophosphatase [Spiroplasma sabaudiense Ar-1343]|uniref:Putative metallophosphatase n=1 Tax=Spiroplasma sabaudiense Ar-1343 TaxID=1276257 RepID=W6AAK7_9MOLU|nr:TIGR00282 family metallophosphoesterase [Spiroplasma sabaudiense]AHI54046.1 putative metallophosphatase [Spiroplasma sabaudiense Ar-1343]
MKILMIGDIYGSKGRELVSKYLQSFKSDNSIDLVIANGENVTHGKSISKKHFEGLLKDGVDVVTSGNHIFKLPEVLSYIESSPKLLKPLNINPFTPGHGTILLKIKDKTVRVTNLIGRSFMEPAENPYFAFDNLLKNHPQANIHLVDFHAEASAEKMAFAWNYDGVITALVGTHTHVQTADEQILPKGTGYITDLGMTGPANSIIGVEPENVIYKEKTGLPTKFHPAGGPGQFCGVIITINEVTDKVETLNRVFVKE